MEIPIAIITGIIFILELIFCFLEKDRLRKIIKPFCLIMLIVLMIALKMNSSYVYGALIFGLIGDIFLIFKKKHRMLLLLGTFAFLVGHLFYIFTFANLLSFNIPQYAIVITVGVGFFTPLIPYRFCYKYTRAFTIPSAIYGYVLLVECALSIILAIDSQSIYAIIIVIGNIFFLLSDALIFISMFLRDFKRRDFYIMLTYLIAQTLMSFGLLFLL